MSFCGLSPFPSLNFPFIVDNLKGQFTQKPHFVHFAAWRFFPPPHFSHSQNSSRVSRTERTIQIYVTHIAHDLKLVWCHLSVGKTIWLKKNKKRINTIAPAKIMSIVIVIVIIIAVRTQHSRHNNSTPPSFLCWNLLTFSYFCSIWNNFTKVALHHRRGLTQRLPNL